MFLNFKECIVVCVVSLEEVNITPGNIPYQYCREIRTEGIGASKQLDYIIIPDCGYNGRRGWYDNVVQLFGGSNTLSANLSAILVGNVAWCNVDFP